MTATPAATVTATPPPTATAAPTPAPAISVTSDDGSAELDIPAGALPPGVSPGDLSVRDIRDDPESFSAEGVETLAVYRLEPHGLEFAAPVTFTVQLELPDGGLLVVYHLSDTVEAPEDVTVELDEAGTGLASVGVALTHFSTVVFTVDDVFAAELTPLGQRIVGVPFAVSATVTRKDPREIEMRYVTLGLLARVVIDRSETYTSNSWGLVGSFFGRAGIKPARSLEHPPDVSFPSPGPADLTVDEQFWCGFASDEAKVVYSVVPRWVEVFVRRVGAPIVEQRQIEQYGSIRREAPGTCVLLILELRNVYSQFSPDDRNTYTARLLYETATGELREFDVEGAGGTVQWDVRAPCGTTSAPQAGDREFWYSHGTGSPGGLAAGGACTLQQEDQFRATLRVFFPEPDGADCTYQFFQDTAGLGQGPAFRRLPWSDLIC